MKWYPHESCRGHHSNLRAPYRAEMTVSGPMRRTIGDGHILFQPPTNACRRRQRSGIDIRFVLSFRVLNSEHN